MRTYAVTDERLSETYFPESYDAREALYAEGTEWLCPACQNEERDTELDHDRNGYVCPACGARYSEAELARACRALLMRNWEHIGELESELALQRKINAIQQQKLATIREAAA